MRLLLPPSETKVVGGTGPVFALDSLFAASTLSGVRRDLITDLIDLAHDEDTAARVLKLGPRQRAEIAHNRDIRAAGTVRALERYSGVLYDALDAASFTAQDWERAGERILVQSALFGPIRATDEVPNYRLSATAGRPIGPLRKRWGALAAGVFDECGFVIDARSESYRALAPIPADVHSVFVRVLDAAPDGSVRALNHFNKAAKGRLASALARSADHPESTDELVEWASSVGLRVSRDGVESGEVALWNDPH